MRRLEGPSFHLQVAILLTVRGLPHAELLRNGGLTAPVAPRPATAANEARLPWSDR